MIQPLNPLGSYRDFVMAMDRVAQRLQKVTSALNGAGVPYAVIGGNAVAAWVAKIDPAATRTTKDVDLLVRRDDLDRVTAVMVGLGFERHDLRRLVLFVDPAEPSRKSGVHLVWSGEKVLPSYSQPAPTVDESVREPDQVRLLSLHALVRMKLTSFRDIDRVHVADLLGVGLIDHEVRGSLPPELSLRLAEVEGSIEADE